MKQLLSLLGCRALVLLALPLPGRVLAQATQVASPRPPAALAAFARQAQAQGLSAADVADPLVTDSYTDASTGLTHTYLQQRVRGLTVFNATGAVHTDRAGRVVLITQQFVPGAAATAPAPVPTLSPEQAVTAATVALGLPRPVGLRRTVEARTADGLLFNSAGIAEQPIAVRLLWARQPNGLVLAWNVTIAPAGQPHHYSARLDAGTGRLLDQTDYAVSERAGGAAPAFANQARRPAAGPAPAAPRASPTQTTAATRSLTVSAMPAENPALAPRSSVLLSSANAIYSPYGWQVGEGRAPTGTFNNYPLGVSGSQLTRGNNVLAVDGSANNPNAPNSDIFSATNSPNGGADLIFDFPLDPAKGPRDPGNVAAGITNVFYWNNVLHDVLMAHGFDEAAGNFQYKNLSGKGNGSDYVVAQVQDGYGLNNANFTSPPDGSNGRMRLYPFQNDKLTVAAPAAVAGTYQLGRGNYGPLLAAQPGGLCGNIVLVNDGISNDGGSHSCTSPYVNAAAVRGNIALIRLGNCPNSAAFLYSDLDKAKLAQDNGATGVIFFDPNPPPTTLFRPFNNNAAAAATITIPVVGVSYNDGVRLAAAPVTGYLVEGDGDASFDNAIIAHEFGHGVSTRLTGGPANSDCLPNATGNQTAGEGWSDFIGLWLTTRPGDDGSQPRYVGTYASGQPFATGPGYRHKPYSTNFGVNNYTYAQLGTGPGQYQETHDVGEVWCTTLWDLNWQLIYKYGYNPDFYAATGGNNKMLQLVLDGCKLQVCKPSFLDSRDALLRADSLANNHANADLIWNVFARRGMGYGAKAGDRPNGVPRVTGLTEAFDLPPKALVIVLAARGGATSAGPLEAYPNPARDQLLVRSALPSTTPVQVEVLNALGQTVLRATGPAADFQRAGIVLNTSPLATGVYVVRVRTSQGVYATKVRVER